MAVAIKKWLKLHTGSRVNNRVVTRVEGLIGRDADGDFACGQHYRKLQQGQAGNWSCPISNCETRIETESAG